ncbi:ATP-grasp domain-containing protein [Chromohalobacter israelensis]|uniref:ATP-grasp domain-containing protein n=1 Tax=Chromohalobacter israelensis TaxID=141390 RepID=UPI000FFED7FC|nr:ATP-grasp domain-containing protein [Chromohalobacter salexigens]RXE47035.1 hypothetical protein B4O83_03090 [Chromohalobacter salexigens]
MKKNVFILGLKSSQENSLKTLRESESTNFHTLLSYDDLVENTPFNFEELLEECRKKLNAFNGEINAILAHWDFPSSALAPILCHELELPAPSLRSVLTCENKLWSRMEQSRSIPENVPKFCRIDPFKEDPSEDIIIDYPFWLKPVKSFSSQLGFKIEDRSQFDEAIKKIKKDIGKFGNPFNDALRHLNDEKVIEAYGGNLCIAEELITGVQGAPEGTMYKGEFNIHGIVMQPKSGDDVLFDRLVYPSSLPEKIHHHMVSVSEKFLRHIGYDNGCFNVEFIWDENKEKLWLVEINTRISQSHSELFTMVDGISNHEVALDIALDQRPSLLNRNGKYPVAAKCSIPYKGSGRKVIATPSSEEIINLHDTFPEVSLDIYVTPGDDLTDMSNQNQYGYIIGEMLVGGNSYEDICEKYDDCLGKINFEIR